MHFNTPKVIYIVNVFGGNNAYCTALMPFSQQKNKDYKWTVHVWPEQT